MTMKSLVIVLTILISTNLYAYGVGTSTYPMMPEKKMVTTELTGITSTGGGLGLQARYTQKINKQGVFDAGLGIAGGDRSNRLFVGYDHEIFPDYMTQPKVTVKTSFENAEEFGARRNIISVSPTISKGFSFWGREAYPYAAMPLGLSLNSQSKTYETVMNISTGISAQIPVEGYRHLTGNVEMQINLKDSYSGVFMGVTYPIN
jgi:hypothetical protein